MSTLLVLMMSLMLLPVLSDLVIRVLKLKGSLVITALHLTFILIIERMLGVILWILRVFDIFHINSTSENDHLITQLLKQKSSSNLITYTSLLTAFIVGYVLYTQTQELSALWTMRFIILMSLFAFINQCILKYRAEHGLYGTCYSEAKEIVSFILEWYRENGNSNSKPPKLVLKQEEIEQCLQVNGGEEYAG